MSEQKTFWRCKFGIDPVIDDEEIFTNVNFIKGWILNEDSTPDYKNWLPICSEMRMGSMILYRNINSQSPTFRNYKMFISSNTNIDDWSIKDVSKAYAKCFIENNKKYQLQFRFV